MTVKQALNKANKALDKLGFGPVEATQKSIDKAANKVQDLMDDTYDALDELEKAVISSEEDR